MLGGTAQGGPTGNMGVTDGASWRLTCDGVSRRLLVASQCVVLALVRTHAFWEHTEVSLRLKVIELSYSQGFW